MLTAKLVPGIIYWSDGVTPFDGYLLLALSLPTGHTSAALDQRLTRQRIPTRIRVPIINGEYDQTTEIPYNSSIEPPNTQYVGWYYDSNDNQIAGPTDLFEVDSPVLEPPAVTLTLPTVSGSVPSDPNIQP